jgi:hypothetical protein
MYSVRHNRSAVCQQASNEFDNGKRDIQEECPTDSIGRGNLVVVLVIVHVSFSGHKSYSCSS